MLSKEYKMQSQALVSKLGSTMCASEGQPSVLPEPLLHPIKWGCSHDLPLRVDVRMG